MKNIDTFGKIFREMDAGKDIYRVSLPLAAGVLAAWIITTHIFHVHAAHMAAALCFALACAAASPALIPSGKAAASASFWVLNFFVAGASCFFTSRVVSTDIVPRSWFADVNSSISALIGAIPFRDAENNALVQAIILGRRNALSAESTAAFRQAGAAHLLALSGMHLGIIYVIVKRGLCVLGNSIAMRKMRSLLLILSTGAYTLMCGAGPSLMRAWLFILLAETGRILGRPQKSGDVFCSALTLHLIFKPEAIAEPGFQLSYLAMVGIVFLWPLVREWYPGRGLGAKIWQLATLSISCQAFTAPLTLVYFGTFPKYFLITNLIAAPLMGVVMVCSLLCVGLGGCEWAQPAILLMEYPLSLLRSLLKIISGM